MTPKPPAFLHRSFQYEELLEPCAFTSITVVQEPDEPDASTTANKKTKRRWLIFVDKRRGLLGRTVLACPTRADPPPGRRRSYHFSSTPIPTAGLRPGLSNQSAVQFAMTQPNRQHQRPLSQIHGDNDNRRGRRKSLPLLIRGLGANIGATVAKPTLVTEKSSEHAGVHHAEDYQTSVIVGGLEMASLKQRAEDSSDDRRCVSPAQLVDHPSRIPMEESSRSTKAGHTKKTHSSFAAESEYSPFAAAAEVHSPEKGEDERHPKEEAVKILLNGLNSPSLVAAAATGGKSWGVFFIDHASPAVAVDDNSSAIATMTAAPPLGHAAGQAIRGDQTNQKQASCSPHSPSGAQNWRLCFLPWGTGHAIPLVEDLCKPIALCIGSSDSSVFVLEEVWERRHYGNDLGRDRDRTDPQQHLHRRPKRYRVCRLGGSRWNVWLSNEDTKRSQDATGEDIVKTRQHNDQVGGMDTHLDSRQKFMDVYAKGSRFLGESETDWDTSSSSSHDGEFTTRSNPGAAGSSIRAPLKEHNLRSLIQPRRRRDGEGLVEMLVFPSSAASKTDNGRHREHPVGLCVLKDGTIVVAFSRSAPLHDGASVAESQGVIRAFPATESETSCERGCARGALSTNAADETCVTTPVSSLAYSTDNSWLITEGLPVITGLAAGAGGAIYLSLCGARHDGAVIAVGSLSTRRRRHALQVDTWREDFRGRAKYGQGLKPSSPALKHPVARGNNGSDDTHSGGKLVRLASGFAAALAVDDDMNLFYITAESKGTCCALWCSVPGAGRRRVSSIRESFPTVRITAAGVPPITIAMVPTTAKGRMEGVTERTVGNEECSTKNDSRNAGRTKGQTETPTAAAAAMVAAAAAERAIALTAALVEDDEAVSASREGRKPLFASSFRSTGGVLAGERGVEAAGNERDMANGDGGTGGQEDGNESVNIAVVSRCRPLLTREMKRGVRAAVFCDGNEIVVSDERLPTKRLRRFGFDRVFGPGTSQARLYSEAVCPVVRKMLDGFNCSVLAYGQTGSGKTFTMEGGLIDPSSEKTKTTPVVSEDGDATACEIETIGIIPRAVHTIFREGGGGGTRRYWVYVSHMEIYNEKLFDLLAPQAATIAGAAATNNVASSSLSYRSHCSPRHRSPRIIPGGGSSCGSAQQIGLTIVEDRQLGVMVKGLTQVEVKSPEEIFAILARSKNNRRTAETMCNVESSRSHGIFCVRVISAEPTPWGGELTRDGRLSLVDLSGSENIKRSGAVGDRAKEAAAIGQSLLALGRVIKALVKHAPHIPYRESKLTRVLGDSLGGNAFTAIILNITPNNRMLDETLNTLTYAKTAQSVRNTPKQRIANKAPTEEATSRGGGPQHLASSCDAPSLSCSIANKLKQWRGGANSRLLSSGSSRGAHIRPWESKVPIRAPCLSSSIARGRFPNKEEPPHQQRQGSSTVPPRSSTQAHNYQHRESYRTGGDNSKVDLSSLPQHQSIDKIRSRGDRRRPLSAGAVPTTSAAASAEISAGDTKRRSYASEMHRFSSVETVGVPERTPRRERQEGAALACGTGTRGGLASNASEQKLPRTRREHQHHSSIALREAQFPVSRSGLKTPASGRKAAWRVFDSTAAEWVHTTVLQLAVHPRADGSSKARCRAESAGGAPRVKKENGSSAIDEDSAVGLTAAAEKAVEEIFERYVRSSKPGSGFLLSREISTLQEIWTRPDAEPPPPRLSLPSKHARRKVSQASEHSLNRRSTVLGSREVSEKRDNDGRDMRVLTREAFVEFCRRAAARDAIFIRHFFSRSGYDCRLELPFPPPGDSAEVVPVTTTSPVGPRNGSAVVEGRKSGDISTSGTIDTTNAAGRPLRRESRSRQESRSRYVARRDTSLGDGDDGARGEEPNSYFSSRPQERALFEPENDELRCWASGGIVDAAELWLWTEDRRDHGERCKVDGLLSKGGGAHVSRAAAAATVGAYSERKRPNSSTTVRLSCPKDQEGDVRQRDGALSSSTERGKAVGDARVTVSLYRTSDTEVGRTPMGSKVDNGSCSGSKIARNAANSTTTVTRINDGVVAGTSVAGGSICTEPAADSWASKARTASTTCEWCGGSLMTAAVHSAAFCDEEVVHVLAPDR